MDEVQIQQFARSFDEAVLGIKNDLQLTYAVTVDALFAACDNNLSCSFINQLLVQHEQELSVDKLCGVLIALKEYQATNPIPEYLITRIFKFIESRILIDQEEDHKWINEAFSILKKEYSSKRMKEFIGLALAPYDIPPIYFTPYLDLLRAYANHANDNDDLNETFIREESEMLRQKYNVSDTGKEEYKKFLDDICNILSNREIVSETAPGYLSKMSLAYYGIDRVKLSLDRKADLGIRGLLICCIVSFLISLVLVITTVDWNILEPAVAFVTTLIAILPWLYFALTERKFKPRALYATVKEKNRNRLYKRYSFDLSILCELQRQLEKSGPE